MLGSRDYTVQTQELCSSAGVWTKLQAAAANSWGALTEANASETRTNVTYTDVTDHTNVTDQMTAPTAPMKLPLSVV